MTEALEPWQLLLPAVVGFLVGSINPATLIARARGIDLREVGSGNPGATNTARAMGPRTGVLVGLLDILKGFLPAALFSLWVAPAAGEVAGLAAVLGHIFSPFLKGKGGKGVATTIGAILGVQPLWAVPILIAFGITLAISKRMGMGAVAGAVVLIALGLWWAETTSERIFGVALGVIVIARHATNLKALIARHSKQ